MHVISNVDQMPVAQGVGTARCAVPRPRSSGRNELASRPRLGVRLRPLLRGRGQRSALSLPKQGDVRLAPHLK